MARRSAAWSHSALLSARSLCACALCACALSAARALSVLVLDSRHARHSCEMPGDVSLSQGPAPLVYSGPAVDYGVRAPPSTGLYQYINI
jgi:hypothetical protein